MKAVIYIRSATGDQGDRQRDEIIAKFGQPAKTYREWLSERTKQGIRAARERPKSETGSGEENQ
jgi:DNA invertase Pin-like site-specific DNA recombinase